VPKVKGCAAFKKAARRPVVVSSPTGGKDGGDRLKKKKKGVRSSGPEENYSQELRSRPGGSRR